MPICHIKKIKSKPGIIFKNKSNITTKTSLHFFSPARFAHFPPKNPSSNKILLEAETTNYNMAVSIGYQIFTYRKWS